MKYYVYLSDTKVDMLYPQIPRNLLSNIAVDLKINLQAFELELSKNPTEQTEYSKLEIILKFIRKNFGVGTIDDPKDYFEGTLPMRWGRWGETKEEQQVVYFGAVSGRTVLGLGGSISHIKGPHGDSTVSISPSFDYNYLLNVLQKELNLSSEDISLGIVDAATRSMTGLEQRLEFVAKRLLEGPIESAEKSPTHILLGSPLYVALAS